MEPETVSTEALDLRADILDRLITYYEDEGSNLDLQILEGIVDRGKLTYSVEMANAAGDAVGAELALNLLALSDMDPEGPRRVIEALWVNLAEDE